ncbi:MAG: SusC/RagA family TonB-linked outer membrane protein [Bacteroidales bacterium]|nr:SusC/RagA family TonB-linked outer membrane protein [Bacteroidales bacterium]
MSLQKLFSARVVTVFAALLVCVGLSAQNISVKGTVSDESGQPVPGAGVIVKGTTNGTMTDGNGAFALTAPSGATLEISCIGYSTVEVAAAAGNLRITLQEDNDILEESVVTALGIKRERKALGYSVSEVNSEELLKNKNANVINSLAGKVPGVNVTQSSGAAGAGASIIIRGANSTYEGRDNTPLFVVDGIIYDNSTTVLGNTGTDGMSRSNTTYSNRVMDINPEDIESMSVLKGAAAAALYGSKAADGAIIITTKKGSEGSVKVDYAGKASVSWGNKLPQAQTTFGRGSYTTNGVLNDQTYSLWGEKLGAGAQIYDNIGNFFKPGVIYDNNVSVSGGTKNNSFYLSLSNFNQKGIVPNTGYNKTTVRFNGEQKFGRLTVGANVSYAISKTDKTLTSAGLYDGGGSGSMESLYTWPITENMSHYLNEDGSKYRLFDGIWELADDKENPYWIINKDQLYDKTNRFTGALNAGFDITDWWNVSARVGYDTFTTDAYTYIAPGSVVRDMYQNGRLNKSDYNYQYLSTNVMSNMHKSFGNFDLHLLVGTTTEATERHNQQHWGYNFITAGTASFTNIAKGNQQFKDATVRKRLVGVYGEFGVAYKNIAYLTVTGRNDWSSTLPIDNRSYFYPSVSGSFVFSELIPQNNILSFGKVRASWARVGKDAEAYVTSTNLLAPYTYGNFTLVGNYFEAGNPYLVPEIQTAWEVGAELKFLNGRIGLDWTYYHSETMNQIARPRLSQASGYSMTTINSGSVINRGQEFALTFIPVSNRNWDWTIVLNGSYNRGTLGQFLEGVTKFYPTDAQFGSVQAASIPNGGIFLGLVGTRYEYEKDADGNEIMGGAYAIDPNTGLYKVSTETDALVGNREPKFIGGLANTLRYKNLSLSFLLDFRIGGAVYNGTDWLMVNSGISPVTTLNDRQSVTLTGVASADGVIGGQNVAAGDPVTVTYNADQNYEIKGVTYNGKSLIQSYWSNYRSNSYNFITDVNWLKLRSLSLTYDFTSLIKKTSIIKGLSATLSGTNLFTITNYKGMDPEVSTAGGTGGSGATGIDYASVPAVSTVSFGVNVSFGGSPSEGKVKSAPSVAAIQEIVREVEVVKEKVVEKEVVKEVVKEVPANTLDGVYTDDIYFVIGKAEIRPDEAFKLGEISRVLKDNPHARVTITGYADSATGTPDKNKSLSARRAEVVVNMLKKAGISADRITFDSTGTDKDASLAPESNRVAVCVIK